MFKSLESIDITKQVADAPKMSAELLKRIKQAAVNGMLQSVAEYCYFSGTSVEDLKKKLLMIINDFRSTGDVETNERYVESMVRQLTTRVSTERSFFAPYASTYPLSPWAIVEDPCIWDVDIYGHQENLSQTEREMIASFREAREAYNEASRTLSDYIRKMTEVARKELLVTHSHVFEQAAPAWLKEISAYLRPCESDPPCCDCSGGDLAEESADIVN